MLNYNYTKLKDKALPSSAASARTTTRVLRTIADQAFSRAAGAPLVGGNSVRLLRDAAENYPAWLEAIRNARRYIHFESYIIHDDSAGQMFAEALIAKAQEGVRVRLVYDWMGGLGKTSRRFWNQLREGGVDVRCYNPPQLDSPLGWLSRDHRKTLTVDGVVGFVTGLCVGRMWVGEPERNIEPWRDTGVEIRGPAVRDIENAFAQVWALMGSPIENDDDADSDVAETSDISLRVVATVPATAGMFRFDQLLAALARRRLWLTDAYYAATAPYVQALRAAAMDGVDVRLLVPSGTDIPLLRPLSRAGYKTLLEAGIRVFEWNGTMLHAKTAVADGHWARVGSTNLNIASWLGNCELDVIIEDDAFALEMEEMYVQDLANSTEVVLDAKKKVRAPGQPHGPGGHIMSSGSGSSGRAAAGVVRIGNTIGAAFTHRRILEPLEARITLSAGVITLALAVLFWFFPKALAYPLVAIFVWIGLALVYRGYRLHKQGTVQKKQTQ